MDANNAKTIKRKEIDISKKYYFPDQIDVIRYGGKILVVSINTANWIVLDNEKQLAFFLLLCENSIQRALELFDGSKEDYLAVLIQIEARCFERKDVARRRVNKMQLFLTNSCNLRCPHCYVYAGKQSNNELSYKEVIDLIQSFAEHGGDRLLLTGGEIKMRQDLFEIIQYAGNLNLKIDLLTNGVLWSDNEISNISSMISSVQISIDGYDEPSNARVRGKGNFNKALNTVDCFINNGVETEVAITPLYDKKLEEESALYVQFGKSLLRKYRDSNFKLNFTSDLLPGRNIQVNDQIRKDYLRIVSNIYKNCFGENGDNPFIYAIKNHELYDNCSYGNIAVSSIGDVYLCGRISYLKPVANVRKQNINEIFDISAIAKASSCIDRLEPCKNCSVRYICGGECRLVHFSHFNDNTIVRSNIRSSRKCDVNRKEFIYDLMIRTNSRLFE